MYDYGLKKKDKKSICDQDTKFMLSYMYKRKT